jgi:hypothetical protein
MGNGEPNGRGVVSRRQRRLAPLSLIVAVTTLLAGGVIAAGADDSVSTEAAVAALAAADPSAVAPSAPAMLPDGTTVSPSLAARGGEFASADTSVNSTIAKDPSAGFSLETGVGALTLTPDGVAPNASSGKLAAGGDAVVFANTGSGADTLVRPQTDGVETFTGIRAPSAAEDFTWKVSLPGGQALRKAADGGVQIVDPTPVPTETPRPADVKPVAPAELPELQRDGKVAADAQASDQQAAAVAERPAEHSGAAVLPAPTRAGDTSAAQEATSALPNVNTSGTEDDNGRAAGTGADAVPPATVPAPPSVPVVSDVPTDVKRLLEDGAAATTDQAKAEAQRSLSDHEPQLAAANSALDAKQDADAVREPRGPAVVAEIKPPTALDADGQTVPASLEVDGDRVTLHVEHHGDDYAYPIAADPYITIRDFGWVNHCCQASYHWEARSHQETRFNYVGSWFGRYAIHHFPHYYWGAGHDGRALYNVHLWWMGWVLMHNEDWSGMFQPYTVTVQDPAAYVFDGWRSWQSWEVVGSHVQWYEDNSPWAEATAEGIPAQYVEDSPDEEDQGDVIDFDWAPDDDPPTWLDDLNAQAAVAAHRNYKVRVSAADCSGACNWASVRNYRHAYVLGNVTSGTVMKVGAKTNKWAVGNVRGQWNGCGWMEASHLPHPSGTNRSGCDVSFHPSPPSIGRAFNCKACGHGTSTTIVRDTIACANTFATVAECKGREKLADYKVGKKVNWRYVSRDNKWIHVEDTLEANANAKWRFVPRSAIMAFPTVPKAYDCSKQQRLRHSDGTC